MHDNHNANAIATSPQLMLVDPQLLKFLRLGIHCKVQLVSNQVEPDSLGIPIPVDYPVIDVLAMDDSRETIESILKLDPKYKDYWVADHWIAIAEDPF